MYYNFLMAWMNAIEIANNDYWIFVIFVEKWENFDKNQDLLRQFDKESYNDVCHKKLGPETQILFWGEVKKVFPH